MDHKKRDDNGDEKAAKRDEACLSVLGEAAAHQTATGPVGMLPVIKSTPREAT
jgi:hypothetical protein